MTVGEILTQTADRWPESEALVEDSRRLTYRELAGRTARFGHGLREMGIEPGDAVGLFTANSVEQVVGYLAIQRIGAVAVPVNPRLSSGELAEILGDAHATALVCDGERAPTVRETSGELPVSHYIATDPVDGMTSFDAVGTDQPETPPSVDVGVDETALMMHTSGTTGRPKLVVLTHRGQLLNGLACAVELGYDHDDRALEVAPLYHSAGYLNLFLPCLQVGATHVLQPEFDPERTLELIETEDVTVSLGVPTHFETLRGGGTDVGGFDTSSLRTLVTSGAPITGETAEWVRENLCETFYNVYGLTETCGLVTVSQEVSDDRGAFRIGEPFLTVSVRLVEVGEDVPPDRTVEPGERGELIVRSPKVMEEYFERPDRTAETLRDGWLYTGDVALKRDGSYYLVDRVDNRIISGGENIYPGEIERVLDDHPAVLDCAVVGADDQRLGQRVVAYVVSSDPHLSLEDVDEYWKRRTDAADFKRPREIRLVDTIPRSDSGKILRGELRTSRDG